LGAVLTERKTMQTKTKRKAVRKLSPIELYNKELKSYLQDEGFFERWDKLLKNVRFLKIKFFLREYKKGTRMRRWFMALKPKDQRIAIDNSMSPFLDANTISGKSLGEEALRSRTLKLLGCPNLQ
jgi:hypothetical protein